MSIAPVDPATQPAAATATAPVEAAPWVTVGDGANALTASFSAALAARLTPISQSVTTNVARMSRAAVAAPSAPSVTLGQMLGRAPAVTSAGPLSTSLPLGAPALLPSIEVAPAPPTAPGGLLVPVQGRVSSDFGPRVHPVTGARKQHNGLDIAAPTGTPIQAPAAGTVTFAGMRGGYGYLTIIDHGDGTETRYAHQDRLSVSTGDRVDQGQIIGTVGSTGMSTGPHLHFEVRRDGEAIDPAPLLGLE